MCSSNKDRSGMLTSFNLRSSNSDQDENGNLMFDREAVESFEFKVVIQSFCLFDREAV